MKNKFGPADLALMSSENVNPDNAEHLLWAIFGAPEGAMFPSSPLDPNTAKRLAEVTDEVLQTLSPREEKIIKMRYGLEKRGGFHTTEEVGAHFGLLPHRIEELESKALRKLRHPSRRSLLQLFVREAQAWPDVEVRRLAELTPTIETITTLTPSLIAHLKSHEDDLTKLHWRVFEHLVAEFFASRGFKDVRLVGQNARTAADIYAALIVDQIGIEHRYFIEVKRWKNKVGIEVIDRVYGALISEREQFGWHAAVIVTAVGFKNIEKWTPYQLKMKGIELRDREDLLRWLRDYQQNKDGLWLPNPPKMPPL